jgi:hypothetical protein
MSSEPLVCPGCGAEFDTDERFCSGCGMPLVLRDAQPQPIDERHARARKVKPQFAEGEPVRVAGASNQAEGEFIQGLLLEEGVPSMLRRTAGFDVPDFLAAGPRDVMVPQAGAHVAREVLLEVEVISDAPPVGRVVAPGRLIAGMATALVLGALALWLATLLLR